MSRRHLPCCHLFHVKHSSSIASRNSLPPHFLKLPFNSSLCDLSSRITITTESMQFICLPSLASSGALTKPMVEIGVAIHSLGLQRSIWSACVKFQRDEIGVWFGWGVGGNLGAFGWNCQWRSKFVSSGEGLVAGKDVWFGNRGWGLKFKLSTLSIRIIFLQRC